MFAPLIAVVALSSQRMHHRQHAHRVRHAKMVNEEPAIRAAFHDVERAFETKNWSLLHSRITSNFQNELPNHQVIGIGAAMKMLQGGMDPLTDVKANLSIGMIKVTGSTAVVEDRYLVKGKMRNKSGKHNVRIDGSERVSLKKVGGRWMAYYVLTHDESESVDGRVVRHMP